MKFLTLLKKELRESLLPIILATLVFGGFTMSSIRWFVHSGGDDYRFYAQHANAGQTYWLFHSFPLGEIGVLLLFASIVLGLTLGALHFGLPLLTRTWAFLLHRPVTQSAILGSKLLVGLIAFGVALGLPWSLAYAHIQQVKATGFPSNPRVFWEGWLFIGLGLALYLGTGLCAMTNARWYTTRLIGPVFAVFLILAVFSETSVLVAFELLSIVVAILLILLVATFLNKGSNL
ncbi:MAG: hypothetical protein IIC50_14800 [Planctomycetes bacterium]|nr:hypothetical protein [Planctomycetota bacterium]